MGHVLQFQRRLCPAAVDQVVSWRLWRKKLSHVLLLVLKKDASASCLLPPSFFCGVCLCVHTSPFHKDIGRIEENPILQTVLNSITFVKILAPKKSLYFEVRTASYLFWGEGSHDSIYLPKNLPGMMWLAWRFSYVESMWVSVVGALLTFCGCLVLVK